MSAVAVCLAAASAGAQAASISRPVVSVGSPTTIAAPHPVQLTFTVVLSAKSTSPVSVHYHTADGTAIAGTDYTPKSGTLTISAGLGHATISVAVLPVTPGVSAPAKSFYLELSHPAGATLGNATATGTIDPDPYLAPHTGSLQDAVIDPRSRHAYITNATLNEVEVLNLTTGTYGSPIFVGSQPLGIDITPDGSTLYVCDSGGQTISVVNTATRKVAKTITTPPGFDSERAFSIAIANNGHALLTTTFSGSGFGAHVYDLNLATDAIKILSHAGINGQVTEDTPLARSADHSTITGPLGDDSGGPFFVYHAATKAVTNGNLNAFIRWGALSGNGALLLVDPGTYVVNSSTGALEGTITGSSPSSGIAVNRSGTTGYRLDSGALDTLNVSRFLQSGTISEPDATASGIVAISPNDHTVLSLTASGSTILRL